MRSIFQEDLVHPRLTFLPLSCLEKLEILTKPKKFSGKFDLAFIGCSLTHLLENRLLKTLKGVWKIEIYIYFKQPDETCGLVVNQW